MIIFWGIIVPHFSLQHPLMFIFLSTFFKIHFFKERFIRVSFFFVHIPVPITNAVVLW